MAFYEFGCNACGERFTVKQSFDEHDHHAEVKCPKCGSTDVEPVLTPAYAVTEKKS
jgi:putative FmdB family regulatory protein